MSGLLFCVGVTAAADTPRTWSGAELYQHTCSACHGADGGGLAARLAPRLAGLQSWYLERQLRNFATGMRGDGGGDMFGSQMVLFARQLSDDEEIERIAAHIAALPEIAPTRQTVGGDTARGAAVYVACAACHGRNGEGSADYAAPRLSGLEDWYLTSQLTKFRMGSLGYHEDDIPGRQMTATAREALTDDNAIADVVAYIQTLMSSASDIRP